MHTISDSGKADYYGKDPHPFFKRVVDNLPAGKLLLVGEVAGQHALYASEAGWEVHAVGFKHEDRIHTLATAMENDANVSFSVYAPGEPLCNDNTFDAVIMMFVHLPEASRHQFHQALVRCLQPGGGNLYLLAYSKKQPAGTTASLPDIRYQKAELLQDFQALEVDLLQEEEEELPESGEKIRLIHFSAVRTKKDQDDTDSVSFSL